MVSDPRPGFHPPLGAFNSLPSLGDNLILADKALSYFWNYAPRVTALAWYGFIALLSFCTWGATDEGALQPRMSEQISLLNKSLVQIASRPFGCDQSVVSVPFGRLGELKQGRSGLCVHGPLGDGTVSNPRPGFLPPLGAFYLTLVYKKFHYLGTT